MMKLVHYSSLDVHLKISETVFNVIVGSHNMRVHLVWTYKRLKQKRYNPCLGIKGLYDYYISGRSTTNYERRILAIYGRGLCHMNKSSLILTSYIRSRWQRTMMN